MISVFYKLFRIFIFTSAICIILSGCDAKEESATSEKELPLNHDRETIELIYSRLPHPGSVSISLERTGTDFDWEFLRLRDYPDPGNDTIRAVIAGLLAADVSYFISFDQSEFEEPYFERLNSISGDMCNVSRSDLQSLNVAFSENQDRRDSLITLLDKIYRRTTTSLNKGKTNDLSTLFAASKIAENLYITSGLINNYPDVLLAEDSRSLIIIPLVRILLEQEPNLEDAILLLNQGSESKMITDLRAALVRVNHSFDVLGIEESLRDRRADLIMADTTFRNLREEIGLARNQLLENLK